MSEDDPDESDVVEESPCRRWHKRKEELPHANIIPGIDKAFLALDTEEGVEVVWNEITYFRKRGGFSTAVEKRIREVFDSLIKLDHPNIVKLHSHWTDTVADRPRLVFVTEHITSGSLQQFLKRTKHNKSRSTKSWKRWCVQILSALCYLHSSEPPIAHGNLTCDAIYIQHNGLIKISTVSLDKINANVRSVRASTASSGSTESADLGGSVSLSGVCDADECQPADDILAFGICALEMAADSGLTAHALIHSGPGANAQTSGSEAAQVERKRLLDSLEDPLQRDLIEQCLARSEDERPTAFELLFHPALFEVPSLRLLASNLIVRRTRHAELTHLEPFATAFAKCSDQQLVVAEVTLGGQLVPWRVSQLTSFEFEKFFEDVRIGVYPMTIYNPTVRARVRHSVIANTHRRLAAEVGSKATAAVSALSALKAHSPPPPTSAQSTGGSLSPPVSSPQHRSAATPTPAPVLAPAPASTAAAAPASVLSPVGGPSLATGATNSPLATQNNAARNTPSQQQQQQQQQSNQLPAGQVAQASRQPVETSTPAEVRQPAASYGNATAVLKIVAQANQTTVTPAQNPASAAAAAAAAPVQQQIASAPRAAPSSQTQLMKPSGAQLATLAIHATIEPINTLMVGDSAGGKLQRLRLTILLLLADGLQRRLTTDITADDQPLTLAQDLISCQFLRESDLARGTKAIEDALRQYHSSQMRPAVSATSDNTPTQLAKITEARGVR